MTLLKSDIEKITKTYTDNVKAYELYLKGKFYFNRRGSSLIKAKEYFLRSIEADPDFALAYSGYADATILSSFYSYAPGVEVMGEIKRAAETAIRLDSSIPEPYCSLGSYYCAFEWNWNLAEENFKKCLQIAPGFAAGHYLYSIIISPGLKVILTKRCNIHQKQSKSNQPVPSTLLVCHGFM